MPHLIDDQSGSRLEYVDPRNLREKEISGICMSPDQFSQLFGLITTLAGSLMCFGIASYNWPGSIGVWGKWASEIDAQTRAILQGTGANIADDGMGAIMKLSRDEELLEVVHDVLRRGSKLY
jgi:hypothetical protein